MDTDEHRKKIEEFSSGLGGRKVVHIPPGDEEATREYMRHMNEQDRGVWDPPDVPVHDTRKIGRCPLWALVHRIEGKQSGSRCTPACQLYLNDIGDCSINVLARGTQDES